jgi:outer membrane lipase/esterase
MNSISLKRLFCAAAVAAATLSALPVQASYNGLVIFGDSLSDSGNNFIALGGSTTPDAAITSNFFVPTYPSSSTMYSNGPVWATSFASMLGLSAAPALGGGSNFAFGGATTSGGAFVPSLTQQVGMFLGGTGGAAPSSFLYVIAGGGNNARAALEAIGANPANTFAIVGAASYQYATDVGNMVDTLQAAGAQDIVVWNTPNLGTAPAVFNQGPAVAGLASSVAMAMNGALDLRLSSESGVSTFDLFGQVAGVIANPGAYGLSNVTDACVLGACPANEYLFWDGIHPSARGHQILAEAMYAQVVPEPETYLMLALGLAALAWRRRPV